SNLFDAPCVIEKLVQIKKEIAVIAARNESGEVATYPPVEMVFDPVANLVDTLLMPAQINKIIQNEAIIIAEETIKKLNIVGLLAVELFLDEHDNLLINEVAPRPHNSGHQTIEACITSQFEQHIRAILNLPLGSTSQHKIACMINILGEENYTGNVKYIGLEKCLASSGIHVHLYGKKKTKPKRKMGHITILGENIEEIYQKISIVKNNVKAISI
ncbi:MAG: ATP-grasp domain-containing protein, partial [Saprospiraceae bacterium]